MPKIKGKNYKFDKKNGRNAMKKLNGIFLFAALLAAAPLAHAVPSFSGALGGSAGLDLDIPVSGGEKSFKVPLSGFAAVQANLTDWFVARGEIALDASDFAFDDIFSSSQAALKLNELSAVFIRKAVSATSFVSAFIGEYEQIGSDSFLMRQFGIEPISSSLSKSATNLSGISILPTRGAGLSYIINFDKAPIAAGGYLYFGKDANKNWTLNFDTRFALATNAVCLDFLFGIGAPLQDSYNNSDVVLMIDTITLRGGANFLLGNKYTHSLLIQAGIKDIAVKGKNAGTVTGNELSFLFEPRIKFNNFRKMKQKFQIMLICSKYLQVKLIY